MAHGVAEPLARNVDTHLEAVPFPATRDELLLAAEDDDAPREVLDFLRALPHALYQSRRDLHRDFAQAARRLASWSFGRGWQRTARA